MWEVSLRERLTGAMVLASDSVRERHIALDLVLRWDALAISISGEIDAIPLVARAPIAGKARLAPDRRSLTYLLAFRGRDGEELSMRLERNLDLANLYTSITVLTGEVRDASSEVARCLVRFDARGELGGLLSSLRVSARS